MLRKAQSYFLEKRTDLAIFAVIFLGTLVWSLTMVRSGLCFDRNCQSGVGFWGANGHDGVWHVALIKSLSSGSLDNPVFAGERLKNYHLGYDFFLSLMSRFFKVSPSFLYFQIFPPVLAFLIGFLVFKLVFKMARNKLFVFWSLFFVYFGGGFGFLVSLVREGKLAGDSMFWAQSQATTLLNPPYAFSLIFLLLGILFFEGYLKRGKSSFALLTIVSWGFLSQIKIYAFVLVILSLVSLIFLRISHFRKLTTIFLGVLFLNILISLPINRLPSSIIEFRPFWFLEALMAFPDRLGWAKFYQAMTTFVLAGNYMKASILYLIAFILFFFGNLGSRFLSLRTFFRKKNGLTLFLYLIIFWGLFLPLFFVQRGTPWNTIQFFYYSLFFLSVFAGIELGFLALKFRRRFWLTLLFFLITLPTTATTLGHYLPRFPQSRLPKGEIEALSFLSQLPHGRVLSLQVPGVVYDDYNSPTPLYAYDSTSYVSAFSGKEVYLEDLVNLSIMGYDYKPRLNQVESFLKNPDSGNSKEFLDKEKIDYIYIVRRSSLDENKLNYLERVFENEDSLILKVDI